MVAAGDVLHWNMLPVVSHNSERRVGSDREVTAAEALQSRVQTEPYQGMRPNKSRAIAVAAGAHGTEFRVVEAGDVTKPS